MCRSMSSVFALLHRILINMPKAGMHIEHIRQIGRGYKTAESIHAARQAMPYANYANALANARLSYMP